MPGKLPRTFESKFISPIIITPDPLMVDGVKSRLTTKWGVSADGTGVVLWHLTIKPIKTCADFKTISMTTLSVVLAQ